MTLLCLHVYTENEIFQVLVSSHNKVERAGPNLILFLVACPSSPSLDQECRLPTVLVTG